MWKIYEKAGEEGWKCLIPFYNYVVLLKFVGKPWWWLLMYLVPLVNIVFAVWTINMLSKSFGKNEGFTVGLIFLSFIFVPILGFGDATYKGPYGNPEAFAAYNLNKEGFDFEQNKLHS
jgi:hypothetical protein